MSRTVTSEQPYVFGNSYRESAIAIVGVKLNTGTVVTEMKVGDSWVNTGDVYTDGAYQITSGTGGIQLRIVCTGDAVAEVS